MNNGSSNINSHGAVDKLDPNVSVPDSWAKNSNTNIEDSQGILTYVYITKIIVISMINRNRVIKLIYDIL